MITYVWVTLALVLTPGATTAVVVRQALLGGARAGLATALGAAVGNTTHATIAGLGLAVVLERLPALATTIRLAGGAYLAWLAVQSLVAAGRARSLGDRVSAQPAPGHGSAFRNGVIVNLLNPAILTFYLVVVPTFLTSQSSRSTYVGLAAIHVGLAFVCHAGWSLAFGRVRAAAHSGTLVLGLNLAAGLVLGWLAFRTLAP